MLTAMPHLTWSHAAMIETLITKKKSQTCEALLE
jgi:hypothetical protein